MLLGIPIVVGNLLIVLSLFPVVNIIQGTGNRAAATNPSKLEAHPAPSLVYTMQKG
jgi:hypothetical protein